MSAIHFIVPGDPETLTGGYLYDKHIARGLRATGRAVAVHRLRGPFPNATLEARADAARVFAAIPDGSLVVADGLAFGVLPEVAEAQSRRLRIAALVHHPLAFETGLDGEAKAALFASERAALKHARRVIVTSRPTAELLSGYGVGAKRIGIVEPGVDAAPLARGSADAALNLLCVATLTPRKGHAVLIAALAGIRNLNWRLTCAGGGQFDPGCARAIRNTISAHGLTRRIALAGEVGPAKLRALYAQADIFVLASFFEGYGTVLSEALARGLPIISTTGGAIPVTVPKGAGLLVEPGNREQLAAALRRALNDTSLVARLRGGARQARTRLKSWSTAAARFATELDRAA